jgi:hypothetical protein
VNRGRASKRSGRAIIPIHYGRLYRFSCTHGTSPRGDIRRKELDMALFMDVHNHIPGLTKDAVAGAHHKDLETQDKFGVKYLQYWYNDSTGQVFCLIEAPSKDAAIAVHREAHGLVADQIFEVQEGH